MFFYPERDVYVMNLCALLIGFLLCVLVRSVRDVRRARRDAAARRRRRVIVRHMQPRDFFKLEISGPKGSARRLSNDR